MSFCCLSALKSSICSGCSHPPWAQSAWAYVLLRWRGLASVIIRWGIRLNQTCLTFLRDSILIWILSQDLIWRGSGSSRTIDIWILNILLVSWGLFEWGDCTSQGRGGLLPPTILLNHWWFSCWREVRIMSGTLGGGCHSYIRGV